MGLIEALQKIVQAGVGYLYNPGKVTDYTWVDDTKGGYTKTPTVQDCQVMVDVVTEQMRLENGYTDKDVALYVLQAGGVTLNSDSVVTVNGVDYSVGLVIEDPVRGAWLTRGTPKHG